MPGTCLVSWVSAPESREPTSFYLPSSGIINTAHCNTVLSFYYYYYYFNYCGGLGLNSNPQAYMESTLPKEPPSQLLLIFYGTPPSKALGVKAAEYYRPVVSKSGC